MSSPGVWKRIMILLISFQSYIICLRLGQRTHFCNGLRSINIFCQIQKLLVAVSRAFPGVQIFSFYDRKYKSIDVFVRHFRGLNHACLTMGYMFLGVMFLSFKRTKQIFLARQKKKKTFIAWLYPTRVGSFIADTVQIRRLLWLLIFRHI